MSGNSPSRVTAIIVAAGKGRRLRADCKPLVKIAGKPILAFSLEVFQQCPQIRDIILVVNRRNKAKIRAAAERSGASKIRAVVLGGARRQDSVARGLAALDEKSRTVLIHDAARPFISRALVERLLRAVRSSGAAIPAVPVKSTIKKVIRTHRHRDTQTHVEKTLDRKELWEAQTPQAFRRDLIIGAYRRFKAYGVTDDAELVERCGHPVAVVTGSYANIKITTPEDVRCARALARGKRSA